jgi:hypothetical protein
MTSRQRIGASMILRHGVNHISAGLIESCNSQASRSKLAFSHGHLSRDYWLAGSSKAGESPRLSTIVVMKHGVKAC